MHRRKEFTAPNQQGDIGKRVCSRAVGEESGADIGGNRCNSPGGADQLLRRLCSSSTQELIRLAHNTSFLEDSFPYTDEPPVMGHGDKQSIMSHRVMADEADHLYNESGKSIENAIANYFENTLKDTGSIICQKSRFFQNLYDINNVDVVGLSYSSVDSPYLQEVKNSVKSDACWTMCYYSDEDKENLKNIIERLENDSKRIKCMHSDEYLNLYFLSRNPF